MRWPAWSLVYVAGGCGSIAVFSAWHPSDVGGGSSAAVAALIGAFVVAVNVDDRRGSLDELAEIYSVFFAVYLTTLDLDGVLASIIVGNAALVLACFARWKVNATTMARATLLVAGIAALAMIVARDDHGVGLLIGATLGAVALARDKWVSQLTGQPWRRNALAVAGVATAVLIAWIAWVHLLGTDLVVTIPGGQESHVGWLTAVVVAVCACLVASLAQRMLVRRSPIHGLQAWVVLCLGTTLVSLAGPLVMADGTASTAALISVHLVAGTTIFGLLRPVSPDTFGRAPKVRASAAL